MAATLNLNPWIQALEKLKTETPKKLVAEMHHKLATQALEGVVARSPVGNPALWRHPAPPGYVGGLFKNNWHVSFGAVGSETRTQPDASGSASISEASKLESIKSNPFVTTYVYNALPYANRIEHGWSSQAPAGVVALTVQSLKSG